LRPKITHTSVERALEEKTLFPWGILLIRPGKGRLPTPSGELLINDGGERSRSGEKKGHCRYAEQIESSSSGDSSRRQNTEKCSRIEGAVEERRGGGVLPNRLVQYLLGEQAKDTCTLKLTWEGGIDCAAGTTGGENPYLKTNTRGPPQWFLLEISPCFL